MPPAPPRSTPLPPVDASTLLIPHTMLTPPPPAAGLELILFARRPDLRDLVASEGRHGPPYGDGTTTPCDKDVLHRSGGVVAGWRSNGCEWGDWGVVAAESTRPVKPRMTTPSHGCRLQQVISMHQDIISVLPRQNHLYRISLQDSLHLSPCARPDRTRSTANTLNILSDSELSANGSSSVKSRVPDLNDMDLALYDKGIQIQDSKAQISATHT